MVSVNLAALPSGSIETFVNAAHRRKYPAKSTIIFAGDRSESLYYIIDGSLTVLIEDEQGREIIIAYLNKGDFVGEMGLFQDEPARSAWVKAKSECEVAELSYTRFRELAEEDTSMLYMLGGQMAARIRNTTQKVGDQEGYLSQAAAAAAHERTTTDCQGHYHIDEDEIRPD